MAKNDVNKAEQYRKERKARIAKSAKKNSTKQISSKSGKVAGIVISVILCAAIVIGMVSVVINQSGVIEKSRTALTIDGQKVSQTEFQYYYVSVYNRINYYAQMYAQYGMNMGPDSSKSLSEQDYDNSFGTMEGVKEGETVTWAQYLEHSAMESLASVKSCVKKANEAGIELSDADKAEVDKEVEELREHAASYSQSSTYSLSAYLKPNYGKGMNEKTYKKILLEQKLAEVYQEKKIDEYKDTFTKKDIEKEYKDNVSSYGTVTFRKYTVNAEKVKSKDDSGNKTEAVTKKTMAAAKKIADGIALATNEKEFKNLVSENEKTAKNKDYKLFISDDSLTLDKDQKLSEVSSSSDEKFTKWVSSAKTAVGSTYIVENADSGYDVYMMVNPVHKADDYVTYDSRHILINFGEDETEAETEGDASEEPSEAATHIHTDENGETQIHYENHEDVTEATTEEVATTEKKEVEVKTLDVSKYPDVTIDLGVNADTATDKEAYKKAQDVLEEYLKGNKTAEAFGELAEKYSGDTGSNENGGLYEGTKVGGYVKPYEEWCLKEGRKAGDVGIVEYSGSNYSGYHILYFVGTNTVKWDDEVKNALASEKYETEAHELLHSEEFTPVENEKVIQNATDFLDNLIATVARNQSSSN